ncbi:MAG: hypothetical protein ACJZ4M_06770 [Candidatus Thalassarchaeaceae archaeon]
MPSTFSCSVFYIVGSQSNGSSNQVNYWEDSSNYYNAWEQTYNSTSGRFARRGGLVHRPYRSLCEGSHAKSIGLAQVYGNQLSNLDNRHPGGLRN